MVTRGHARMPGRDRTMQGACEKTTEYRVNHLGRGAIVNEGEGPLCMSSKPPPA